MQAPTQWLDVLTAVGTVGAVIVALWAALWGRHVQAEQAKDRAGLLPPTSLPSLSDTWMRCRRLALGPFSMTR